MPYRRNGSETNVENLSLQNPRFYAIKKEKDAADCVRTEGKASKMSFRLDMTEKHYAPDDARPGLRGILIPGRRGKLLSVLYLAAGEGPHPTVILFHGIPGFERNFDMAHILRRAGFHVMVFHYSGSWGSDGNYSLANNLEDANTVLDYLLADPAVDSERVYSVGHSLGGFVSAHITASRPEIKGGVMLMPCDMGRNPILREESPETYAVLYQTMEISAPWLSGTSAEALMREAEENSEAYRFENLAGSLAEKPVLCVTGELDACTVAEYHCLPLERKIKELGGTRFTHLSFPTDHSFADYRLTISEQVTDFLLNLTRE